MSKSITVEVHYKVEVDEKEIARICKIAKENGQDHGDAGPILMARRLLQSEGIEGVFPNEHRLGLKITEIN